MPEQSTAHPTIVSFLLDRTGSMEGIKDETISGFNGYLDALEREAGDLVAYCPDQLGPGVSRVLHAPVQQVTYPRWGSPRFVDWVDYARANKQSDPIAFARRLVTSAGPHQIFLVWARGYRTLRGRCTVLAAQLTALRPGQETEVVARNDRSERETLYRYPPP